MPRFQDIVTDNEGNGLPGAIVTVRDYPSGNLSTLTADSGGSLTNPIVADSNGAYYFNAANAIYSLEFRLLAYEPAREVRLVNLGNLVDSVTLAANTGAGLIGTNAGDTVQAELNKIGTRDLGVLSNTGDTPFVISKTASGNSGGASDWRALLQKVTYTGIYGTTNEITGVELQNEAVHTAGTITFHYGMHGYTALGTGTTGQTTGAITSMRGIEWHTANKSSNAQPIAAATNFYSSDVDLDRSGANGTIGAHTGFYCGNVGHASRITTSAVAFDSADMTGGAPVTVSFRSAMSSGTGKWAFLGINSAPSAFAGGVRIGDNTRPTDLLEVKGFAKLTSTGTITQTGGFHEIVSGQSDYAVHIRNTAASAPQGLRIRFTGATPNDTTESFLLCEDATTTRFQVYSDGTVLCTGIKVATNPVVGARQTGWTADTGTAKKTANATYAAGTTLTYSAAYVQSEQTAMATRMAAVELALQNVAQAQKAIKDALITHGLIGT